jgi:hypothetical protein
MSAQEQPRQADHKGVIHMAAPVSKAAGTYSAFTPLLLALLALLLWLGWQTSVLVIEREGLASAYAGQQQTVDNAGKLRASLDSLAADTQRLAQAGNGNAALLVAELNKRGITINPQSGGATAAAAAK